MIFQDNLASEEDRPEGSDNTSITPTNRAAPFSCASGGLTRLGSPHGRQSRPVTGASHNLDKPGRSSRSKRSFVAVQDELKSPKKPGMLKDLSELDPVTL